MTRAFQSGSRMEPNEKGAGLAPAERQIAEQLIAQANALEQRLSMTEYAVALLDQTLDSDSGLIDALNDTYESHAFNHLQLFLLGEVVNGLCAGVLDPHRDSGSVRRLLAALRQEDGASRHALRAYHADSTNLHVTIGEGMDDRLVTDTIARHHERYKTDAEEAFDEQWPKIDKGGSILNGEQARRLLRARNKLIAHYDPSAGGLLDFGNVEGLEGFSWGEPIEYFRTVRPYVYDFYLLVTRTEWDDQSPEITEFYAKSFWERFKSGESQLEPPQIR